MIATGQVTERRQVHFRNLDDILADVERITAGPYRTVGNWSLGQILEHLAKTIDFAYAGFGKLKAPWYVRWFIAPVIKNRFLTKPMPAGFQLPKRAEELLPAEVSTAAGLDHLRRSLAHLQKEPPSQAHPGFGMLAWQEWKSLCCRHAELHLSFVVPE